MAMHGKPEQSFGEAMCQPLVDILFNNLPEIFKCGEQNGLFYDRRGDYFREGIDPRNYFGRLVEVEQRQSPRAIRLNKISIEHEYDCPAGFSDSPCDCGEPD